MSESLPPELTKERLVQTSLHCRKGVCAQHINSTTVPCCCCYHAPSCTSPLQPCIWQPPPLDNPLCVSYTLMTPAPSQANSLQDNRPLHSREVSTVDTSLLAGSQCELRLKHLGGISCVLWSTPDARPHARLAFQRMHGQQPGATQCT